MKQTSVVAFATLLLVCGFVSSQTAKSGGYYPKGGPDENVEDVSLIQLIANPQLYDNKRIRITGFLVLPFEGEAIYLHREDFDHALSKDALWIDVPRDITQSQIKILNGQYAICTGKFVASNHGHMGLFSGEMTEITRLELWGPSLQPPPKRTRK